MAVLELVLIFLGLESLQLCPEMSHREREVCEGECCLLM